jgi:hypothetical protein
MAISSVTSPPTCLAAPRSSCSGFRSTWVDATTAPAGLALRAPLASQSALAHPLRHRASQARVPNRSSSASHAMPIFETCITREVSSFSALRCCASKHQTTFKALSGRSCAQRRSKARQGASRARVVTKRGVARAKSVKLKTRLIRSSDELARCAARVAGALLRSHRCTRRWLR